MSKVINKIVYATSSKNKNKVSQQRSYPGMNRMSSGLELLRKEPLGAGFDNSDINGIISDDQSPRSVNGNHADEVFITNSKPHASYDTEGSLNSNRRSQEQSNNRSVQSSRSTNDGSMSHASGSRTSKGNDISMEQNSPNYLDHVNDNYCDYVERSPQERSNTKNIHYSDYSNSSKNMNTDFSNSNGSLDEPIQFRLSGRGGVDRTRSRSVQRAYDNPPSNLSDDRRRSRSTSRTGRYAEYNAGKFEASNLSPSNVEEPKRKSKMEKIFQLQEKNQRYKDEFRKVQKDRKALKLELEQKRNQNVELNKEIDAYILEIATVKQQLTSAMQAVDRNELNTRKDRSLILKLQKDLSTLQSDHTIAYGRVARLREEVEAMKILLCEKDEKIRALSEEVTEQLTLVDALHLEIIELKKNERESVDADASLKEENDRLQVELCETLERASSMVKEREDAIADLLKDNDDLKRLLVEAEASVEKSADVLQVAANDSNDRSPGGEEKIISLMEEISHLREELRVSAAALEEAQDRNILLEEDVEAWIVKKDEMESLIQSLNDEIEALKAKLAAADRSMSVVEASAQESAKKVALLEITLKETELKHNEQFQEQERRHTEALLDQKEKIMQQVAAANDTIVQQNPQELMLQKAVADRKAKEAAAKGAAGGIWSSVINRVQSGVASPDTDEKELSAEQKRIKELETINADQELEITTAKSEMVKLKSTYNDTLYNNKKRIEQLEQEKAAFELKQQAMELHIKELQKEIEQLHDGSGSTASF